jgi:hypothetical protein
MKTYKTYGQQLVSTFKKMMTSCADCRRVVKNSLSSLHENPTTCEPATNRSQINRRTDRRDLLRRLFLFLKRRLIIYSTTLHGIKLVASYVFLQTSLALMFTCFRQNSCCNSDHKPTTGFILHTAIPHSAVHFVTSKLQT